MVRIMEKSVQLIHFHLIVLDGIQTNLFVVPTALLVKIVTNCPSGKRLYQNLLYMICLMAQEMQFYWLEKQHITNTFQLFMVHSYQEWNKRKQS